jgi:hypothetical protein
VSATRSAAAVAVALAVAGCGTAARTQTTAAIQTTATIPAALARGERPIGAGPRFHPSARGPAIGPCRRDLGPRAGVHVELFGAGKVILIAVGIGAPPPRRRVAGRIVAARCFGALVTRDPTGVLLVRPGARLTLADLFRSWGRTLSARRMLSFRGPVSAWVGGRRWHGPVGEIPLTRHAEVVVEVGPHVPPHRVFRFPPGT